MKTAKIAIVSIVTLLTCLVLGAAIASTQTVDGINIRYNKGPNLTVVWATETLIDATTSIGAAFNYPGTDILYRPKMIDVTLYGYHNRVEWQNVKSLSVFFNGKTFTAKVDHYDLRGENRDTSEDLLKSVYLESISVRIPLATAQKVFNCPSIGIRSNPAAINVKIANQRIEGCRSLVNVIPSESFLQRVRLSFRKEQRLNKASRAASRRHQPTWVTILHMEGSGDKASDPFTVSPDGGYWYISYDCQDMQAGDNSVPGNFIVELKKPDDASFDNLLVNMMGEKSDTTDVYSYGTFYLDVSTDEPFTLDVNVWK